MAENLDIRENEMQQGTAAYLRGIDASGNSILVTITSIINACFIDRGLVGENFNFNNAKTGVYTVNKYDCLNQPFAGVGTLVSAAGTYKIQLFMAIIDGSQIFIRVADVGNNWKPWRKIQSTSI